MPLDGAQLADYCQAPASVCERAGCNCAKCDSSHKGPALERVEQGIIIVKSDKKPQTL